MDQQIGPTSPVPMKCAGRSINLEIIMPLRLPCFFFSSILNLLALMKAISYPAKKAMNKRHKTIPIMSNVLVVIVKTNIGKLLQKQFTQIKKAG